MRVTGGAVETAGRIRCEKLLMDFGPRARVVFILTERDT